MNKRCLKYILWINTIKIIVFIKFRVNIRRMLLPSNAVMWRGIVGGVDLSLQWRHNGRDSVSNQQPHDCFLNRLFRQIKKTSRLRVTGLCAGKSPEAGDFPAQMASITENVSIKRRHHDIHNITSTNALYEHTLIPFHIVVWQVWRNISTKIITLHKRLRIERPVSVCFICLVKAPVFVSTYMYLSMQFIVHNNEILRQSKTFDLIVHGCRASVIVRSSSHKNAMARG